MTRVGRSALRAAAPAGRGRCRTVTGTLPTVGQLSAVDAPVSQIGRRDPGCRGVRTSSRPGANPMVESGTPTPRTYPPHQVGGVPASATFPATVQDPSPHHLGRRKHARDPGHRGRRSARFTDDPTPRLHPGARSLSFTSAANSCTMSPPTRENTPHLDAGSRYGPTPAATADRPPPAVQEQQWTPTLDPGDRLQAQAPTSPTAPLDLPGSATSTLATLPEVLTVSRGRGDPADRAQPALPSGRARRAGRGPHRPQHPHPQTSPAGSAYRHQPTGRRPTDSSW